MIVFPRVARTAYAAWRSLGEKRIAYRDIEDDSLNPAWSRGQPRSAAARARLAQLREKARYHTARIRAMDTRSRVRYVSGRAAAFLRNHAEAAGALLGLTSRRAQKRRLAFRHTPRAVAAAALVVRGRGHCPHAPGIPFELHGALARGPVGRVAAILSGASRDGT